MTLTDTRAIMDVLTRYARACDERRWDLFEDVFTEDVVFEAARVHRRTMTEEPELPPVR